MIKIFDYANHFTVAAGSISRKFYTLTKDKEMLFDLFYNKPLNDLVKYKSMEVEINKNLCLVRHSRKPVSKTEAVAFCELAKDINRIFN